MPAPDSLPSGPDQSRGRASRRHTWSSTFGRFSPGQIRLVGPLTLGVYDWTRPQPGQPAMFNHGFFEWFTCARPRTLVLIFVPGSAYFVWDGLQRGVGSGQTAALFAAGLLVWTFLEYLLHRFVLHPAPRTRLGVVFGYLIHGVHHAFPEDGRRWLMPPIVSVPVAGVFLFLAPLALGAHFPPLYAGVVFGYLCYDLLHYAIHRGPLPSRLGRSLRTHHLRHHYRTPESRFGVSTTIWDRVFGTAR